MMAFSSSGVKGFRNIVSVSRVGTSANGLKAPKGSRCLNVARRSLRVSFQVLAVTWRSASASKKARATGRVTSSIEATFGCSAAMNPVKRLSTDSHWVA
ncbi:MAG: hypothetical protein BWX68_02157 [Verrucomicrobia bacterium ADurb.Bin063]|nr:MAG: hypothetical protein BWX68_02157 [Verrucomicrobia bacterium ADurb.Bin063]